MTERKLALVTGASGGIGRAIALRLARYGYDLWLHFGADLAAIETVASKCIDLGASVTVVQADLATMAGLETLATTIVAGRSEPFLDVLINNAGRQLSEGPDTSPETFDTLIAINAKAPFFLTQKLAPFIRNGGRIINISSGTTLFGIPEKMVYAMAKGAMNAMTKSHAKWLAPRQITVNAVLPGIIHTGMNPWVADPEKAKFVARMSVFNRVGQPDDIAGIAEFLASDASGWMTGELIEANGGGRLG